MEQEAVPTDIDPLCPEGDVGSAPVSPPAPALAARQTPRQTLANKLFIWVTNERVRTTFLINLASIMERVDEQLLPSVYRFVGRTFHARPTQLSYLTTCRAFVQAISSPLGGLLGHHYDRTRVITAGCLLWGCVTALFSQTTSITLGYMCWAVNGIGLSLVIPSSQSLVADYYREGDRGKAFGLLYLTGAVGGMLGALYGTNTAAIAAFGWQGSFLTVALASVSIGLLTHWFARDPHFSADGKRLHKDGEASGLHPATSVHGVFREIRSIVCIPTFCMIIVQGVVGSFPWNALVFFTFYLQLLGMSDIAASALMATFMAGTAMGGLIGGWLGDIASRQYPNHGRILVCQFSVFSGIPLSIVLFKLLPFDGSSSTVALYFFVLLLMGLLISWAAPACNSPIFAEIVPPHMRSMIYAFDRSFEGAIASMGAPIVSNLAEKVFGYTGTAETGEANAVQTDLDKARSLANALLVCTVVPWSLCLLFYSGLHLTYPRDRRAALLAAASAADVHIQLAANSGGTADTEAGDPPLSLSVIPALPREDAAEGETVKLIAPPLGA
ncbi:hypothetical protein WJX72_002513 [[Myrmecia] bisecta]|uniref:Major facilitator superfamily (MFS) profile domain-containing protein n=1 Tax=[Myrmecia] bisecta TaxID=41462 RepID=A0AAW1QPP8_9CHLO